MRDITKPKPSIETYSKDDLLQWERNYLKKGVTDGGLFSLFEIRLELLAREGGEFTGKAVVEAIRGLLAKSTTGLVTRARLFKALKPDLDWAGPESEALVVRALGSALHYCMTQDLPLYPCVVVAAPQAKLTQAAVQATHDLCARVGLDMGRDTEKFIEKHCKLVAKHLKKPLP